MPGYINRRRLSVRAGNVDAEVKGALNDIQRWANLPPDNFGLLANRPIVGGYPGETYYAIDTTDTYTWNDAEQTWLRRGSSVLGWEIRATTPQSIPDITATSVLWDQEWRDTSAFHSGSLAAVTVPETGTYLVSFSLRLTGNVTGVRGAWIRTSVDTRRYGISEVPANISLVNMSGSAPVNVLAGSTIWVDFYQTSGAALNINPTGNVTNHFSGALLRG